MLIGIQTEQVVNNLQRLSPSDPGLELPSFEPGLLTPVFTVDPTWVGQRHFFGTVGSTSINGVNIFVDANDATLHMGPADSFALANNRLFNFCSVDLAGATVSPIVMQILFIIAGSATAVYQFSMPNPGRSFLPQFLLGPGMEFSIGNVTLGGVGDTQVTRFGGQVSPAGVGLPSFPRGVEATI